ncbi:xanthine phosphoribosyltransferase [Buchnera aphidicola]|uniref:Xanthine phosphoribosyltransferase n=1 Tax=Buchnera aphidicola (Stegophylla sp.) TaxID=2315800 RepID=A0A4D6YIV9_9GAMM|nr:xanthine phosphoribosyltransferase [Buchnera aphidicola (Stegophylla sp.)]QCI26341.1 xanthine phosphoribosyltransferase [Buchnera aphidicola (Stegophylla sp.)]
MYTKYSVTWYALQMYVKQLAYKLSSIRKWRSIVAVSRGGLIPAALLAQELNIRLVDTICIDSYNGQHYNKKVLVMKTSPIDSKYTLIVDDLVDTGRTAQIIRSMYPKSYFVTIFAKPQGEKFVHQYVIHVFQYVWIEQPYDILHFI